MIKTTTFILLFSFACSLSLPAICSTTLIELEQWAVAGDIEEEISEDKVDLEMEMDDFEVFPHLSSIDRPTDLIEAHQLLRKAFDFTIHISAPPPRN